VTATRSRNRRGEGGRLREEILTAATELMDSGGLAVTLRAVAHRAGISAPSIYQHFPDRSTLVLAVVRESFAELADLLRAAADDSLFAVCDAYVDFARRRPERYRVMFGGLVKSSDEEAVRILSACCKNEADGIALWLVLHGFADQRAVSTEFHWPADLSHQIAAAFCRPH
jgi:AcrR family transcriptional regulator